MSITTLGAQDSLVPFLGACPKNRRVLVFMSGYGHIYLPRLDSPHRHFKADLTFLQR
jgi:hypothetical protein